MDIDMGRALSVGVEDVRPSRDVRSLLIPESPGFSRGEYVKREIVSVTTDKDIVDKLKTEHSKECFFLYFFRSLRYNIIVSIL